MFTTESDPPNYTVLAIPAYWLLCFIPHIYSSTLLKAPKDIKTKDPNTKYRPGDNIYNFPNPNGKKTAEYYAKILDKSTYNKWERARSASSNLFESTSFVFTTLVIGIVTKLPASFMNTVCALYLFTRVVYLFAYIGTERGLITVSRTAL